jgi:hypothetical protein
MTRVALDVMLGQEEKLFVPFGSNNIFRLRGRANPESGALGKKLLPGRNALAYLLRLVSFELSAVPFT